MARTFVGAFNTEVTCLPWTTPTTYPHVSPTLLASSSGGALEVAFDDMSLFLLKFWDAEDRVILGCLYRLFGLSLLVLGNYPPRHGPWALVESGPGRKFSSPTLLYSSHSLFHVLSTLSFYKIILSVLFVEIIIAKGRKIFHIELSFIFNNYLLIFNKL